MPLWKVSNLQASAPKYKVVEGKTAVGNQKGNSANLFNNVSVGVFKKHMATGVFGANAANVSGKTKKNIDHTGWHYVRQWTGPVVSVTITAGGTGFVNTAVGQVTSPDANNAANATFTCTTNSSGGITAITMTNGGIGFNNLTNLTMVPPANGIVNVAITAGGTAYSNADTFKVSNGQVNAIGTITTNTTGGITAATITSAGRGFPANTNCVVTITTGTGSTATIVVNVVGAGSGSTLTPVLGGRAGRVHYETLVAGGMTGSPPATLP